MPLGLGLAKAMAPHRPAALRYGGVRELYLAFRELFRFGAGAHSEVRSSCGHTLRVFDHNFFHMTKLDDPRKPKPLLMEVEEPIIMGIENGFGPYTYDEDRAVYLPSVAITMIEPDEVWLNPELKTADWAYLKEFDATPYSHTILYVARRRNPNHIVPVTSFKGTAGDARRKGRGVRIYP